MTQASSPIPPARRGRPAVIRSGQGSNKLPAERALIDPRLLADYAADLVCWRQGRADPTFGFGRFGRPDAPPAHCDGLAKGRPKRGRAAIDSSGDLLCQWTMDNGQWTKGSRAASPYDVGP